MNFYLTVAPSSNFCGGKFHLKILTGSSRAGAPNKGGVRKISHFLGISVNISKAVADTAKVFSLSFFCVLMTVTNRKSHYELSIDTKIDDLG